MQLEDPPFGNTVLSLPNRGGSPSAQLFRSADGDRVRLPANLNSRLNPQAEGTWNPLCRLVSLLYPPCIVSFRSLSLGSPAAPHTDTDTKGGWQPVCKYQRGPGMPLPLG